MLADYYIPDSVEGKSMFKVKITVVDYLGDENKYPCHFGHQKGDKVIYDGEKYIGRLCPDLWPLVAPKAFALHTGGPRYIEPWFYAPFWYSPLSARDSAMKKYDGLGFRNVYKVEADPKYHMAYMTTPHSTSVWPDQENKTETQDISIICPDSRTAVKIKLEPFDLSDKGYDIPYFRRQMVILSKVLTRPGIAEDRVLGEFTKEQIYGIYPALSPHMMKSLIIELNLMSYIEIRNGQVSVTKKGEKKLKKFISGLSADSREAIGM
jgi:uncharacterized repeat protein (TIGR04076 family)